MPDYLLYFHFKIKGVETLKNKACVLGGGAVIFSPQYEKMVIPTQSVEVKFL